MCLFLFNTVIPFVLSIFINAFTYELLLIISNRWMAAQSVFYHLYNQVSYMSLDEISPLTFSIGNTMKRISVIVSSIIIFHTPVQPVNALGAAIAIFGTFLYSQVCPCSLYALRLIVHNLLMDSLLILPISFLDIHDRFC